MSHLDELWKLGELHRTGVLDDEEFEAEKERLLARSRRPPARTDHNLALAALLSLLIPGLGQLYKRKVPNAVIWFIVVMVGYLLLLPGIMLHICCIIGAAQPVHR